MSQITFPGMEAPRTLLVLSLQPPYWQLVLDGRKRYEYRRLFRRDAVDAFIYVTKPVGAISGWISFGEPIVDRPQRIAEIAESESPGSYAGMMEYLDGCQEAYAVPILEHRKVKPVGLKQLRREFSFSPPQGYVKLGGRSALGRLLLRGL